MDIIQIFATVEKACKNGTPRQRMQACSATNEFFRIQPRCVDSWADRQCTHQRFVSCALRQKLVGSDLGVLIKFEWRASGKARMCNYERGICSRPGQPQRNISRLRGAASGMQIIKFGVTVDRVWYGFPFGDEILMNVLFGSKFPMHRTEIYRKLHYSLLNFKLVLFVKGEALINI